jgi:putative hydrolase of the HAD superfamily
MNGHYLTRWRAGEKVESLKSQGPIRAVTLDVGGTLVRPWPSVGHVYAELAAPFGYAGIEPGRLNEAFGRAWEQRGDFDYSRAAWRGLVTESFGALEIEVSEECFAGIYEGFGRARTWREYDDVRPALAALTEQGIRLGIISNWDERLRPLLAEMGLLEKVEAVVVSQEIGARKPARESFAAAARLIGFSPGEILHVGDSRREDFEGARAAGFEALWLCRQGAEKPGPIFQVASLTEVSERLLGAFRSGR